MHKAEDILRQEYYKYYRPYFGSDDRANGAVKTALCIKEETTAILKAMEVYANQKTIEELQSILQSARYPYILKTIEERIEQLKQNSSK